jgi:hypothetical protein
VHADERRALAGDAPPHSATADADAPNLHYCCRASFACSVCAPFVAA